MADPAPPPIPAPLRKPEPGDELGLGAFVCKRASRVLYIILAVVFGPIGVGCIWGAVVMLLSGKSTAGAIAMTAGFGLLFLAVAYACIREARTTYRFYEQGVAKYIGRRARVVIAWVEATELTYKVIKQYYNGIPLGSNLTFQIKTDDNRKVGFTTNHRTKVKSRKLFGPKEVVAFDELDFVRDMVSEVIADRMGDRLLAGETLDWCGAATLSEHGLTPKRGSYKKELVPYSEIDRESAREGAFSIYHKGETRAFLTVPMAANNFWPGVALLHRMVGATLPEGAEEVIVEEGASEGSL